MNEGTKLLSDKRSPNVNGTLYCDMVGSFIYLTNTHLDIFFNRDGEHVYVSTSRDTF